MWHSENLDTRAKIVGADAALEAAQRGHTAIVTGHFDPLLVEHARRLRDIRAGSDSLIVVLLNPPDPILSSQARAELVAALDVVDYVVLPAQLNLPPGVFREESTHKARFDHLVQYVHRRHRLPVSSD